MRNLDVRAGNGPARENREGYVAAAQGRGKPDSLRHCLQRKTHQAIHDAREKVAREQVDVGEQIVEHNQVIATKQARQAAIPADKSRADNAKAQTQNELIQYRHQTRDIKKPSGFMYTLGKVFVWLIAAFLLFFYQSAVYSAFLDKNQLAVGTVFVPLGTAYAKAGWGILIMWLLPTIFIGLGLSIHWFIKYDKIHWMWRLVGIVVLVVTTFAFDYQLASNISNKNMGANAANAGDFWLVILCGFVTYIIWGVLFYFTMEEREKIKEQKPAWDEKEQRIQAYNAEIRSHEATLAALAREDGELPGQIRQLEQRIEALEQRIAALEAQLTNGHIITRDTIVPLLAEFTEDWVAYIYDETGRPDGDPDVTRDDVPRCHDVYDNFINNLTI